MLRQIATVGKRSWMTVVLIFEGCMKSKMYRLSMIADMF